MQESSSKAGTSKPAVSDKCQVCFQPSHGRHFGADTCRACAAFFRRYNVPKSSESMRPLKCRLKQHNCQPHENGRWYCKKCRLEKCIALGMRPDNIQLDRDLYSSTASSVLGKKLKDHSKSPPKANSILVQSKETELVRDRTYVDLTKLVDLVSNILETPPVLDKKTMKMNTLERLAYGLQQVRKTQLTHDLGRMEKIGKEETVGLWEQEITNAAKWLMYSDEFRELSHSEKFTVVKCMWHLFNRLERVAMTAEMRVKNLCGPKQFVISHTGVIDFDTSKIDVGWITDLPVDKINYFLGPISAWFNDQQVNDFIELQPSDMELTFLLCNLCFQMTGKRFHGSIEEYTDKLQEVLANDLHKHYVEKDRKSRYSHRLIKLLSISKDYQNYMHRRKESAIVGSVLNAFKINFSHPEMFFYSC